MPQLLLPIFPDGVTEITPVLGLIKKDGQVTYFHGGLPVFTHDERDLSSFRMITAQFCASGTAKQAEICRVFGVHKLTMIRAVKLFRTEGPASFYAPRRTRGPAVLTKEVLALAQEKLNEGLSPSQVADELDIKSDTLRKAILAGRLKKPGEPSEAMAESSHLPASTKSERSVEDSLAPMGMGTTNTLERVAAAFGEIDGVDIRFRSAVDVPNGGVLFAVPALLACGLLRFTSKHFALSQGYYGMPSIFLLLAFMALCRLRSVEQLRYQPPGEWGKLLGLDRAPEVRTLRNKIHALSESSKPSAWSADLCAMWMEETPDDASILYVDGHVRVYCGYQTKLPRHYVARQKLCLRATVDYWVNAMDGQPFFLVNKVVDPGLVQVLEKEIVPRLEQEVPNQPTQQELKANPLLHRFTLVFDREGYSPDLFRRLKERRIACLTYHKHPGEMWCDEEFVTHSVQLASDDVVEMDLAERGVFLANRVWVREVRKKTRAGGQTSIISTDFVSDIKGLSSAMFARWSQKNFFRYMREHYGLDKLADHRTEEVSETTQVVNPAYRELEGQIRRTTAVLSRKLAQFGEMGLNGDINPQNVEQYQRKKATLQEEISQLQSEVEGLKSSRKATKRHIPFSELPEEHRFTRLSTQAKHFVDTIKMVAYRAETAMVHVVREQMKREEDARSFLRAVYNSEADLVPDEKAGTLTVKLHHLASQCSDDTLRHLCDVLNETETRFPGTELRLVYDLVSSKNPPDQES